MLVPTSVEHKKMTWPTLDAAIHAADTLQKQISANGNPYWEHYCVFRPGLGVLYRTRATPVYPSAIP